MPVYEIDPLHDSRWSVLVESHPRSSIFHTREWLDALRRTYKYKARAFTTSAPGNLLSNGIVFCQVKSWLTGSRLVSLPFSDHCEPLVEDPEELRVLMEEIGRKATGRFKYAEIRPRFAESGLESSFRRFSEYYLHTLNLEVDSETLYSRLHKDSVQRKIRRAD